MRRDAVLRALSTGCSRRTAAELLGVSVRTVSRYAKRPPRLHPPDPKAAKRAAELILEGVLSFDRAVKLLNADPDLTFRLLKGDKLDPDSVTPCGGDGGRADV